MDCLTASCIRIKITNFNTFVDVGWDSSVGIATRYGMKGPVGARFSAPVQTSPGAHPASFTMGTGSLPRVKRPGRCVDHPSPTRFKKG